MSFSLFSLVQCLRPALWRQQGAVTTPFLLARSFRASDPAAGLEEFFPRTENVIEESEKTGRAWEARELRHKSNSDLHKLWYVLLKERNMLLTLRHEANRQRFIMPAPERLDKVKRSMAKIKVVVGERERAVAKAKAILRRQAREKRATAQLEYSENLS